MNIAWLRNIGDTEDACWVPCAKGDIGAVEFKNDDAPATPAVGGEAELREQLHYMTGTCELAMKHRDIAEAKLAALATPAVGEALSDLLQDWHDSLSLPENYKKLTLEQIALLNGECLLDVIQKASDALRADPGTGRDDVIAECAAIADQYDDCGGSFIAQKIRDLYSSTAAPAQSKDSGHDD